MCSYNAAFGKPTCANDALNNKMIRGEWGWGGFFVSDCTALYEATNAMHAMLNRRLRFLSV